MARRYRRDRIGRFAGGGSAPSGTIVRGGGGVSGSVARSLAASQGPSKPNTSQKPRLQAKKGAKMVMKEGIGSPTGSARAAVIKASAAERKASREVSAAKKTKGPAGQAKLGKALTNLDKAERAKVKALDKLTKAARRK
jgi:hypothetical protein